MILVGIPVRGPVGLLEPSRSPLVLFGSCKLGFGTLLRPSGSSFKLSLCDTVDDINPASPMVRNIP